MTENVHSYSYKCVPTRNQEFLLKNATRLSLICFPIHNLALVNNNKIGVSFSATYNKLSDFKLAFCIQVNQQGNMILVRAKPCYTFRR